MLGVLEVEIAEGDRTLDLLIAIGGPVLVLLGAIAAAVIAAKTAGRRQERQLANDQLALREQLAHDRKLRYEAHVRDVLDRVVEDVDKALNAHVAFKRATLALERARREEEDVAGRFENWKKRRSESIKALEEVLSDSARLRLRLGDHPVVAAHLALHAAWMEHENALDEGGDGNRSEEQIERSEQLNEEAGERFAEVMPQFEQLFIEQGRE